jgi:hypothetical protein
VLFTEKYVEKGASYRSGFLCLSYIVYLLFLLDQGARRSLEGADLGDLPRSIRIVLVYCELVYFLVLTLLLPRNETFVLCNVDIK